MSVKKPFLSFRPERPQGAKWRNPFLISPSRLKSKGFLHSLRSVEMTTGSVKKLILASGSPQRKRILRSLGIPFKGVKSGVREVIKKELSPRALSKRLALKKAQAIAQSYPDQWVLGVDTLVVLSNKKISGKPKNKKEAKAILKTYPGKFCDIYSGIALINLSLGRKFLSHEKARLYFKKFKDREIDSYLELNPWQGSSGAMTIEGVGEKWIKKLKGDYWNVVGLPVKTFKKLLKTAKNFAHSSGCATILPNQNQ